MELTREDLERLYDLLLLTRTLDDRLRRLFRQGRFEGTYFSAIGQEATTVVPTYLLKKDDFIGPAHREIGAMITRGVPIREVVCQVYARKESPDGGKMHPCTFGHPRYHILVPATLMAMQIPVAVGVALGYRNHRRDNLAVTFFGEGATCKGDFHEALNFAGVHKLPVVFICQNNFYAESVPLRLQTAAEDISVRAVAYGFPGVSVDGNDVLKVYEACREAFQRARSGGGPTLIECTTYRWYGHSDIDLAPYRPQEEVEAWKKKDPIPRFKRYLFEEGILTEEKEAEIIRRIAAEIDEAIDYAENSPRPDPEDVLKDVYATDL